MMQKGIVQYNQCEGENDDKSGVEVIKLWLELKSLFKLQPFSDWLRWTVLESKSFMSELLDWCVKAVWYYTKKLAH